MILLSTLTLQQQTEVDTIDSIQLQLIMRQTRKLALQVILPMIQCVIMVLQTLHLMHQQVQLLQMRQHR